MSYTGTAFGKLIRVAAKKFTCAITVGLKSSRRVETYGGREFTLQEKYRVILIWLLAMVWAVDSRASAQVTATQSKQDQAEVWVRENYHAILDLISQDKGCAEPKGLKSMRWTVCVRVTPGYQTELEYLLSFVKGHDGTTYAQIARPQGSSIYAQLLKLKANRRYASPAELAKLVAVETREGDQQTFPALLSLSDEFERIRLSPVLSDELMLDPTTYFVRAESSWGERMELVLYGPGPSAPHQPHPLLEWVEGLRRLLSGSLK